MRLVVGAGAGHGCLFESEVPCCAGEIPFHHGLVRKISSLVHSLPAMDSPDFNKDYLTDYNDTLLAIYLASMTKGVSAANDIVDKFTLAYEKSSSRRRAAM